MFLGTPHRGSEHASLGDTIRRIVSAAGFDTHGQILQALQPGGEILEMAREEFCGLWRERGFIVRTFQESQGIAGVRGLNGKVRFNPFIELGKFSLSPSTGGSRYVIFAR